MDQFFGALKADYTQRIANARVVSGGRALNLQGRIRVWCDTMDSFNQESLRVLIGGMCIL